MWGTVNDLSPMEDLSARELSNITILDSPEDAPWIDQFGECCEECAPGTPAEAFHAKAALHDEEVMEQESPEGEREGSEDSEGLDSQESSPQNSSDSTSHTEDESEGELPDMPTDGPTVEIEGGPMDEPAVKPMDESPGRLTQEHPPANELAEEHPSTN